MIDFIFGGAGAGKSTYIYRWISEEAVKHPEQKYYLFVPEQNTLQAQRRIIEYSERHGMLNLDVLSFQLCAYRVLEELGIDPPVLIDDVAKSVLIRKAVLELSDNLKVYKKKVNSAGFISQIKNLISEFYQYDVDTEHLKTIGETINQPLLKGKIHDVCSIYERFREKLEKHGAIQEEVAYTLLEHIAKSELFHDSIIVFDGYTGFTPVQLRLLEHIVPMAKRVRFSISMPMEKDPYRMSGADTVADLYWLGRETVSKVCEIAEKNNIRRGEDTVCSHQRTPAKVRLISCEDPIEETRLLARDIRQTVLTGKYRYKRIAVAAADPAGYRELIKRELTGESIPFFIDDRTDSIGDPAVEYIRSALSIISSHYRYDDVMAFLKNPLNADSEDKRERADLIDNYLRKTGLRGRKALEGVVAEDLNGVFALEDAIHKCKTLGAMIDALAAFCVQEELRDRILIFADKIESKEMLQAAAASRRVIELIPGMFERIRVILGEETAAFTEFAKLIDAGFRDLKGGNIPETMDMVIVGDLKRSRFDEIDILYVLGANDGLIPSTVTGGGIFTDFERMTIQAAELELAPDDKTDSCIQRYYLNLILNKPVDRLNVLYSRSGRDGRAIKPSMVLEEIEKGVYGEFDEISHEYADLSEAIGSKRDAVMNLAVDAEKYKTGSPKYFGLIKALEKCGNHAEIERILQASLLAHGIDSIQEDTAELLYNNVLEGSVTRIENYEGCAFYHFIRHGLGLREREEHEIGAIDIGNLYHQVLDGVFKKLKKDGTDLQTIPEKTLFSMCDSEIDSVVNEYNKKIFDSSAKNKYLTEKLRKTAIRTLLTLKDHLEDGDFVTHSTEKHFNYREDNLNLQGVIDRVDSCDVDGKTFVKIIDYKSGDKTFSLSRTANGLDLQLITYMKSALKDIAAEKGNADQVIPVGMFYYHINDPLIHYTRDLSDSSIASQREQELKMHGAIIDEAESAGHIDRIFAEGDRANIDGKVIKQSGVVRGNSEIISREEFEDLMHFAGRRIKEDTEKILKGDINILPYREGTFRKCDYCKYHGICCFDPAITGYSYRKIAKYDRDEAFEIMRAENTHSEKGKH